MAGDPAFLTLVLLALLPALGTLVGVGLAEWREPPDWLTGAALHCAAGIATAVASIELIPRAREGAPTALVAAAILSGAFVAVALSKTTRTIQQSAAKPSDGALGGALWGVYAAIAIDLFTDGLMIGSGASISHDLGLLLAVSQVLGNLPGGFAVTANFRSAGLARHRRLAAALGYPLIPACGAIGGFVILRGGGGLLTGFVLALFAGLLLTATIEDIVPQADEPGTSRAISSPAFAGGFVLLLLMATYLGQ